MASTGTPRSPSTSSDSSDTTMLDAPTRLPPTPTRPRQPSLSVPERLEASIPPEPPTHTFSLLLSLPRELRNRVYVFALRSPHPFSWPAPAPRKHHVAASLLRANKHMHREAAPLLYAANTFLFTHPSDCTVFRLVASPYASQMHTVYLRIREKDLPLWTKYLGSNKEERCLKHDLPRLTTMSIFLRCANAPRFLAQLAVSVQAVPASTINTANTLLNIATNTPTPHHAPHPPPPNHILAAFLRHERELGIESLCLSLRDTLHHPDTHYTPTAPLDRAHRRRNQVRIQSRSEERSEGRSDRSEGRSDRSEERSEERNKTAPHVKIVCIMRLPKSDLARLVAQYPDELTFDRAGDARTAFGTLHGADVCLELSALD